MAISPTNRQYPNKSIQYKYERPTNRYSNMQETASSANYFNKSTLNARPDLEIDLSQSKAPLNSIYSSSMYSPKVIKPVSTVSKDNSSPKSSTSYFRPSDSTANSARETNPRFPSSSSTTTPNPTSVEPKKSIPPLSTPAGSFKRSPHPQTEVKKASPSSSASPNSTTTSSSKSISSDTIKRPPNPPNPPFPPPTSKPPSPPPQKPPSADPFKRSPDPHPKKPPPSEAPPTEHVHFTSLSLPLLMRRKNAQNYYKFGLHLLEETNEHIRAAHYIRLSADYGNVKAMSAYATMLYDGYNVNVNRPTSCPNNRRLSFSSANKGAFVRKSKRDAARYFKMAADRGDLESMRKLRTMLYEGDGVEKDRKTAALYYKIDADKGDVDCICRYATMLLTGDGVEKDVEEGTRYMESLVKKGDINGIRTYAKMFQTGCGVEYSMKEALRYFQMAADLGDIESARQIMRILESGCSFLMGRRESAKYYKMVADTGDDDAMKKYEAIINDKKR